MLSRVIIYVTCHYANIWDMRIFQISEANMAPVLHGKPEDIATPVDSAYHLQLISIMVGWVGGY